MPVDPDALEAALRDLAQATQGDRWTAAESFMKAVIDRAAAVLRVECVGILLLDQQGRARTVVTTGPAARALEHAQEQLGMGPGIRALQSAAPLAIEDLAEHPEWRVIQAMVQGEGVRAVLAAPILVRGEVVGNLNAVQPEPFPWPADMIDAAQAFARVIGALLTLSTSIDRAFADRDDDPPDAGVPS